MSEPTDRPAGGPGQPPGRHDARAEAEHRRRRAAVFGDSHPDEVTDPEDRGDEWLRSQVPPHHG